MKVLIGALGLGKYAGTTYRFDDDISVDTDYFTYALTEYVKPDKVLVIVTEKATKTSLPELKEWIDLKEVPLEVIDIPNGKDKFEAWQIFNAVVEKYDELFPPDTQKPEVYLDITNGFRSIPILMLSIARYLQNSRQINLKGVFYGAYDAVDRENNVKPVYKLDSFIDVLDWASAVDVFKRTGSAILLAELLEQHKTQFSNAEKIIESLKKLSNALDLTLSQTITVSAYEFTNSLRSLGEPQKTSPEMQLVFTILKSLEDEFSPFAVEKPEKDVEKFVEVTGDLIEWYLKRERYANALQLSREWCITWCMYGDDCKFKELSCKSERKKYASKLYNDIDIKGFWEKLTTLRNRMSHAESQADDVNDLNSTIDDIKNVIQEVLELRKKRRSR